VDLVPVWVNDQLIRIFELYLDGQPFYKIGGDGGLQGHPVQSETLVIPTGERAYVIVTPKGAAGDELIVRSLLFNRGYGSVEYRRVEELFTINVAKLPPVPAAQLPQVRRSIEPLSTVGATKVNIDLTIAQLGNGTFEYGLNGVPLAKDKPLKAAFGETQVWTVTNKTKWSHPFHLHGFFFGAGRHGRAAAASARLEGHGERTCGSPESDRLPRLILWLIAGQDNSCWLRSSSRFDLSR
jgi:FtsP/CotA-like multicopper oxidase with cupredoxin domain